MWWTRPNRKLSIRSFSYLLHLSSCQVSVPQTMRSCHSRIPEEYFVCYQMSLHNWVIIKVLYRYFRKCLLGCMDRDWDLSLHVTERYLWALSVIQHHKKLASKWLMSLVTGSCITEQVKRLFSNEIELGMEIPMIESRASNISPDKGNCIRD
jgi:hypothetical protein